jgi:hypothetical protein
MSGSPQRLAELETALHEALGLQLDRSERTHPKDWRLDGISLPGAMDLVSTAVERWFHAADGRTFYSQVSRMTHSDVLVALALVDDALRIRQEDDGLGFVSTALAFWGGSMEPRAVLRGPQKRAVRTVVEGDADSHWQGRSSGRVGRPPDGPVGTGSDLRALGGARWIGPAMPFLAENPSHVRRPGRFGPAPLTDPIPIPPVGVCSRQPSAPCRKVTDPDTWASVDSSIPRPCAPKVWKS